MKVTFHEIRKQVDTKGYVSRNWCLSGWYTRLAARIDDLEKMGYVFETEARGNDFIYKVIKRPAPKQLTLV